MHTFDRKSHNKQKYCEINVKRVCKRKTINTIQRNIAWKKQHSHMCVPRGRICFSLFFRRKFSGDTSELMSMRQRCNKKANEYYGPFKNGKWKRIKAKPKPVIYTTNSEKFPFEKASFHANIKHIITFITDQNLTKYAFPYADVLNELLSSR